MKHLQAATEHGSVVCKGDYIRSIFKCMFAAALSMMWTTTRGDTVTSSTICDCLPQRVLRDMRDTDASDIAHPLARQCCRTTHLRPVAPALLRSRSPARNPLSSPPPAPACASRPWLVPSPLPSKSPPLLPAAEQVGGSLDRGPQQAQAVRAAYFCAHLYWAHTARCNGIVTGG